MAKSHEPQAPKAGDMMNYNTERPQLKFSEYGRIVQKLIEHAVTIEDREQRNKAARYIIEVMGMLNNPAMRQNEEYRHKLCECKIVIPMVAIYDCLLLGQENGRNPCNRIIV